MLGDCNAKLGREDNFRPTIDCRVYKKNSNNSGVTAVNFSKSENLAVKSSMFPH
jgi:hypothetical protein